MLIRRICAGLLIFIAGTGIVLLASGCSISTQASSNAGTSGANAISEPIAAAAATAAKANALNVANAIAACEASTASGAVVSNGINCASKSGIASAEGSLATLYAPGCGPTGGTDCIVTQAVGTSGYRVDSTTKPVQQSSLTYRLQVASDGSRQRTCSAQGNAASSLLSEMCPNGKW